MQNKRLVFVPLLFSIYTIVYLAVLNRATPFRGEHWALLYGFLNAPSLRAALSNVTDFVCFGVTRFQPAAFYPAVGSYLLFGTNFLGHYLASIVLHVMHTFVFLHCLDRLRHGTTKLQWNIFARYPLEAALFLVAFPMSDVLHWTFFHYVQIATILGTSSFLVFLGNHETIKMRIIAFGLSAAATLIYEPFFILGPIYLGVIAIDAFRRRQKPTADFYAFGAFVMSVALKYSVQYGAYYQKVAGYNETQHDMVAVPVFGKMLFCLHKFAVMLLTVLANCLTSTYGIKKHIYELHTFNWIERGAFDYLTFTYLTPSTIAFTALAGVLIFAGLYRLNRRRPGTLQYLGMAFALFFLIAWGRPVIRDYAIAFQFRYVAISFALLLPLLLEAMEFASQVFQNSRRIYVAALVVFIAVNNLSTFRQGTLLAKDMADLSRHVADLRKAGFENDRLVKKVAGDFSELQIPVTAENKLFTYNAQQCIVEWRSRTTAALHNTPRGARPKLR